MKIESTEEGHSSIKMEIDMMDIGSVACLKEKGE